MAFWLPMGARWAGTHCVKFIETTTLRRDGRVVEGARLESVFRGNSNVGSNPTLTATPSVDNRLVPGSVGILPSFAQVGSLRRRESGLLSAFHAEIVASNGPASPRRHARSGFDPR